MTHSDRQYTPAAGRHWQLPFYDLVAKLLGADPARRKLLERVVLRPRDRALDVGSGTGSLAIELKRLHPPADVVRLDDVVVHVPPPGSLRQVPVPQPRHRSTRRPRCRPASRPASWR